MEVHYSTVIPPVSTAFRAHFGPPRASSGAPRAPVGLEQPLSGAWARSSFGARRPHARSRRGPRSPCRPTRTAGTRRGRAPAAARAPPRRPRRSGPRRPLARSSSSTSATSWSTVGIVEPARRRALDARPRAWPRRTARSRPPRLRDEQRRLLDPLVGREPAAAREALAPPADRAPPRRRGASRRPCRRSPGSTDSARKHGNPFASRVAPCDVEPLRACGPTIVSPAATVRRAERAHHRVDDRAHVVARRRRARAIDHSVSPGCDDDVLHVRETLGGGEGRPSERRPRTRDRQHEAQADQRGEDAPTSVDGTLMAARRSGAGLTIGLDQTQTRDRARPGREPGSR